MVFANRPYFRAKVIVFVLEGPALESAGLKYYIIFKKTNSKNWPQFIRLKRDAPPRQRAKPLFFKKKLSRAKVGVQRPLLNSMGYLSPSLNLF